MMDRMYRRVAVVDVISWLCRLWLRFVEELQVYQIQNLPHHHTTTSSSPLVSESDRKQRERLKNHSSGKMNSEARLGDLLNTYKILN